MRAPGEAAQVLSLLRHAVPLSFEAVGSTSTVFKMKLDANMAAAFKAATAERPLGPLSEVTAYRVSRCLGLTTVPPAISRRIPLSALESAFKENSRADFATVRERLIVGEDGLVHGASIYWLPELHNLGIDSAVGVRRFNRYLTQDEAIPILARSLAGHVSTMLLFDYLVGNFDRYSGSNARGDVDGTVVFLRDHDMAFPARMPDDLEDRLWARVQPVQRFSRSFVDALRALDESCVIRELARDPAFTDGSLIEPGRLRAAFKRRDRLLTHIDQVAARVGDEDAFIFP